MANNIIGFIGVDTSDALLYLSRILYHLGKRTLLVDCSHRKELLYSIPNTKRLELFHYNGVDVTASFKQSFKSDYDDILIYYGYRTECSLEHCTSMVFATDLYIHNVIPLSKYYKETVKLHGSVDKTIVIRNALDSKIKPDYILKKIDDNLDINQISVISSDLEDMKGYLINQYNTIITFKNISFPFKEYLKETIKRMYPVINNKLLKVAYQKAERGAS